MEVAGVSPVREALVAVIATPRDSQRQRRSEHQKVAHGVGSATQRLRNFQFIFLTLDTQITIQPPRNKK